MSNTPIVLTKEAALQIREALAGVEAERAKLAADLKTVTEKAAAEKLAAEKVLAEKVAAAKPDLTKVAGEIADRMAKGGLIGAQFRDKTAAALADPAQLANYFTKALDLLEKQAAAKAEPRRIGTVAKQAASVDSKDKLAEANRAFERGIGLG
jgi:hypothetical protein